MNHNFKDWVRSQLGSACVSLYGMVLNGEGEIMTQEATLLKWAIRDSKAHEPWSFSITLAMNLAAAVKRPPEEIAEELMQYLRANTSGPWTFIGAKGYINVYFKPISLRDYIEGKDDFNWEGLEALKGGCYGKYRLQVMKRALEARGIVVVPEAILEKPLKEHPFKDLFNYPEKQPTAAAQSVEEWETWLSVVVDMTRLGYLRHLNPETEEILLTFIKACLN